MNEYKVWLIDRETEEPREVALVCSSSEEKAKRKAEAVYPGTVVAAIEWTGASDGADDGEANAETNFRTWLAVTEDGNGKIHIFYKTIDESESWALDAMANEIRGHGVTILAMYREGDIVEYTGL